MILILVVVILFGSNKAILNNIVQAAISEVAIDGGGCSHSYTWRTITSSTCTTTGSKEYKCTKCSYVQKTQIIPEKGHNFGDATCTAPAKCSRCSATNGTKLGHSYKYEYESGSVDKHAKMGTCTRCKNTTEVIENHSFNSNNTCTKCGYTKACSHSYAAATCTKPKTCTKCGATSGSKLDHTYVPATCTTAKKCTRCNTSFGGPLGHSYAAATCTKPKTCTKCGATNGNALGHNLVIEYESGSADKHAKMNVCTRCNYSTEVIENHSFNSNNTCTKCGYTKACSHSYAAATCTKPKTCTKCGATSGSKLDHTYVPATCTTAKKCTRCNTSFGGPLGHSYAAATCTTAQRCTSCNATNGNALGHNLVIEYESDSAEKHAKMNVCTRCNYSTEVIENHTFNSNNVCTKCGYTKACSHSYVAATCTTAKKCTKCNTSIGGPLGHSYAAATCTTAKRCTRCNETTGNALGHNLVIEYESGSADKHAKINACTRCNYSTEVIENHTFNSNNVCTKCGYSKACSHSYAAATCTKPKTCTKCGATSGSKLDHTYVSATCTTAKKCTRCNTSFGGPLGHSYTAATCTTAQRCTSCNATNGNALGHNLVIEYESGSADKHTKMNVCTRCNYSTEVIENHTFNSNNVCTKCGYTKACSHSYAAATCTTAKKCTKCNTSIGGPLGHSYAAATCTTAKRCTRCNETNGNALGHNLVIEYESDSADKHAKINACTRCNYSTEVIENHTFNSNNVCTKCGYTKACSHSYAAATCTTAKKCTKCNTSIGGPLGHSYAAATCTTAKRCTRCNETSGNALGHNLVIEYESGSADKHAKISTCTRCKDSSEVIEKHTFNSNNVCTKCGYTKVCSHSYTVATCTKDSKCTRCGHVKTGTKLGHTYTYEYEAGSVDKHAKISICTRCKDSSEVIEKHTFNSDNVCTKCAYIKPCSHIYAAATCTTAKKCTKCGATSGNKLGHEYKFISCVEPERCVRCGSTTGTPTGHPGFSQPTCAKDSECIRCGYVKIGTKLEHNYKEATCTSPMHCTRCGQTSGIALGHGDYIYELYDYKKHVKICTRCLLEQKLNDHEMKENKCILCHYQIGSTCEHDFTQVTCTTPKQCKKCKIIDEMPFGHRYVVATCVEAATCTRCGTTKGEPLGHNHIYRKIDEVNHSVECLRCDYTGIDMHSFVNSVCTFCKYVNRVGDVERATLEMPAGISTSRTLQAPNGAKVKNWKITNGADLIKLSSGKVSPKSFTGNATVHGLDSEGNIVKIYSINIYSPNFRYANGSSLGSRMVNTILTIDELLDMNSIPSSERGKYILTSNKNNTNHPNGNNQQLALNNTTTSKTGITAEITYEGKVVLKVYYTIVEDPENIRAEKIKFGNSSYDMLCGDINQVVNTGIDMRSKVEVTPENAKVNLVFSLESGNDFASINSSTGALNATSSGTIKVRVTDTLSGKTAMCTVKANLLHENDVSESAIVCIAPNKQNASLTLKADKVLNVKSWAISAGEGAKVSGNKLTVTTEGTIVVVGTRADGTVGKIYNVLVVKPTPVSSYTGNVGDIVNVEQLVNVQFGMAGRFTVISSNKDYAVSTGTTLQLIKATKKGITATIKYGDITIGKVPVNINPNPNASCIYETVNIPYGFNVKTNLTSPQDTDIVEWTIGSGNECIANVGKTSFTIKAVGQATINGVDEFGNIRKVYNVNVYNPLKTVGTITQQEGTTVDAGTFIAYENIPSSEQSKYTITSSSDCVAISGRTIKLVKASKSGVKIKVSYNGVSKEFTINITEAEKIKTLKFTRTSLNAFVAADMIGGLEIGGYVKVTPEDAPKNLIYTSSNEHVGEMIGSKFYAQNPGSTTITVSDEISGLTASMTIVVEEYTVDFENVNVPLGFNVKTTFTNPTNVNITQWVVESGAGCVNVGGKSFTVKAVGQARINGLDKDGNVRKVYEVNVYGNPLKTVGTITQQEGTTVDAGTFIAYENIPSSEQSKYTITSSSDCVAISGRTIHLVEASEDGIKIKVAYNGVGKDYTIKITETEKINTLKFTRTSLNAFVAADMIGGLEIGGYVKVTPEDAPKNLIYTSSNEHVGEMIGSKFYAQNPGSTTITVSDEITGLTASMTIVVEEYTVDFEQVNVPLGFNIKTTFTNPTNVNITQWVVESGAGCVNVGGKSFTVKAVGQATINGLDKDGNVRKVYEVNVYGNPLKTVGTITQQEGTTVDAGTFIAYENIPSSEQSKYTITSSSDCVAISGRTIHLVEASEDGIKIKVAYNGVGKDYTIKITETEKINTLKFTRTSLNAFVAADMIGGLEIGGYVKVTPEDAPKNLIYTSSNERVGEMIGSKFYAQNPGSTTITVSDEITGLTASMTIVVEEYTVDFEQVNVPIGFGVKTTFTSPKDVSIVKWEIESGAGCVNVGGKSFTVKAVGQATINGLDKNGDIRKVYNVNVYKPLKSTGTMTGKEGTTIDAGTFIAYENIPSSELGKYAITAANSKYIEVSGRTLKLLKSPEKTGVASVQVSYNGSVQETYKIKITK